MLFSFSDPLWAALSLFLSLFPPLSPQWGSPSNAGQEVGLLLSSSLPPFWNPASLVYIPLPLFGDLKVPPPCVECTHSHLLNRERKQGPTYSYTLVLTLTIICWLKAMSALLCLRCLFSTSFVLPETGIVLCAYLLVAAKVRDFFFFLRQMGGYEGEGKEKGGRTMTGVTERERKMASIERKGKHPS